ncbi:hypothetical protein [Flavobacterium sp.]|uniref:hypothetical protein n=1 Tax=Flavobacterium sp. TaxID=239 RepID=UPI003BE176A5
MAAGVQSGDAFQITNPDYDGTADNQILKGDQAYMKVVSQSLVGSGYAPLSVMNPLLESVNGRWPGNDKSKIGEANGSLFTHNSTSYTIDNVAPGLGERAVALEEELSEEEKQIYIDRGTLLKQSINESSLTLGFLFDIPNSLSTYSFKQTDSHYSDELNALDTSVSAALITAPSKRAFISASLIECLLMLTDVSRGVKISGIFGLNRAVLSESDKISKSSNPENGIDKNNKNSISDHVFGRAFDIRSVGDYSAIGGSKDRYAIALDMILQKISALPQPLMPDLIVIHPDVAKDKGISEGFDQVSTAIKIQYPSLKYVNFEFGPEHTDNIHISFSPQRGGKYIGSDGWTTGSSSSQSPESEEGSSDNSETKESALKKAFTNYKNGGPPISLYELFVMLSADGPFSEEAAAIFCAITGRESGASPAAYNGACSDGSAKSWGGDVSVGMFQYNLISLINKSTNTTRSVPIYYSGSSNSQELIPAHKLMYTIPEASTWDPNAVAKKLVEIYNNATEPGKKEASKTTTDERLWFPINQIWMLIDKWGRADFKNANKIDTSSGFYHWGDYSNSDGTPRSDCGFIFKTKFQDAVNVYLTTGKPIETLEDWVRTNFKKNNTKTIDYIEQWMDGTVFYDKPKDGSLINEEASGTITYEIDSKVTKQAAGGDGTVPSFTKYQIEQAADWISINKIPQWLNKYRTDLQGNFQCDRFARVLSAALGLFGTPQNTLFTEEWVASGTAPDYTVNTPSLDSFATAGTHLDNLKNSSNFYGPDTEYGKNPPAGYLVFWTGGSDNYGHDGISVGNGQYVDQHDEGDGSERIRPRNINSTTFPGSAYKYAGASSVWKV